MFFRNIFDFNVSQLNINILKENLQCALSLEASQRQICCLYCNGKVTLSLEVIKN